MLDTRLKIVVTAVLAAALVTLPACGNDDTDAEADLQLDLDTLQAEGSQGTYQAESIEPAYVGEVDSDLFIGVSLEDAAGTGQTREALAYLCDGTSVAHWLSGELDASGAGTLASDSDDAEVSVGLEANGDVSGTVAVGDEPERSFTAAAATGDAGLFRAERTFDGDDYVAGWVVLADGRQLGGQQICFRDPRTGDRICRYMK